MRVALLAVAQALAAARSHAGAMGAPTAELDAPSLSWSTDDMLDYRCVDSLPDRPRRRSENRIIQVAWNGKAFLGLSAGGRVAVWDIEARTTRLLDRRRLIALAGDGAVGLAIAPGAKEGINPEVRELASDKKLGAQSFENGLAGYQGPQTLAVSRRVAVLREGAPACDDCDPPPQVLPQTTVVHWQVETGESFHHLVDQSCGEQSELSPDGHYHLCVSGDRGHVTWTDMLGVLPGQARFPETDELPRPSARQKDRSVDQDDFHRVPSLPGVSISSARLSPDGTAVYLAYRRSWHPPDEGQSPALRLGWRLERWRPARGPKQPQAIDLLASAPAQLCAKLLAASPDGHLLIFGGKGYRATSRRAPSYTPLLLGEGTETLAAAFSSDGAWLVTGHADGHLELWDGKTLTLRLTSHSDWPGAKD